MTTVTKSGIDVYRLAEIFRAARDAALLADTDTEDGGTCNCDTPAFRIHGIRQSFIEKAAAIAEVDVTDFTWFGGCRWFWLNVPIRGQGNRRARMMHAAQQVLDAVDDIPGWSSCGYYQMD